MFTKRSVNENFQHLVNVQNWPGVIIKCAKFQLNWFKGYVTRGKLK